MFNDSKNIKSIWSTYLFTFIC